MIFYLSNALIKALAKACQL